MLLRAGSKGSCSKPQADGSLLTGRLTTHAKIVVLALAASTLVVWIGIAARLQPAPAKVHLTRPTWSSPATSKPLAPAPRRNSISVIV
jgi:hypothetical protein